MPGNDHVRYTTIRDTNCDLISASPKRSPNYLGRSLTWASLNELGNVSDSGGRTEGRRIGQE